ncbi:MAG: hypothetical protein EPN61_12655 [Burkholderiaceae bacterium]|nr:MAG: hypothetical protein EPN61_12655 [Burkholderiaceae bacterium]
MTSLAHPAYPAQDRARVARIESTPSTARPARKGLDSSKGLAAMLLAAVVAALLVAANQMVDNWSDGNLLAAWVILWAVGFAALGLCAGTARKLAVRAVAGLDAWSQRVALARADARYLALAKEDPRIMADLQRALDQRSDDQVPVATADEAAPDRYTGWFSHYMNKDGRVDEYETRTRAGGVWLSQSW